MMNTAEIGRLIRMRRVLLKVDQRSLSEICGISVHALSDIESGKGNPTLKSLNRVLEALGMELSVGVKSSVKAAPGGGIGHA
ncbi:MAG: helix-turn-helix domain-containing protein [Victivallales bacterium]|nr:helix-turn-helix domain-containing protein [Victivallales bacterium]